MDIQTLNYSIAFLTFTAFFISLLMFSKIRNFPGSLQWLLSILNISIGNFLLGLRDVIPDLLSIHLANLLLYFVPAFMIQSFRLLLGIPNKIKIEYWLSGIVFIGFVVTAEIGSTRERVIYYSLVNILMWGWGGVTFLFIKEIKAKLLISVNFFSTSILSLVNVISSWNMERNISLLHIHGFYGIYLLFMLGFIFAIFSSYVIIVNQKLMDMVESEKESLLYANQSKEKLFNIIAHDLKGPFSAILQGLGFAIEEKNLAEKNLILERISYQAKVLFQFLENILRWVKTQQNGVKYNKTEISLKELIEGEIQTCMGMANEKHIKVLISELNPDLEFYGDKVTSGTVIRNLLSNSIKFTPIHGSIQFFIQEIDEQVQIIIEDSGIGLSETQIESFNKRQLLNSTFGTQGEAGHGLGLAICREYVEGNGGTIQFEKSKKLGTKVIVSFPKQKN
ncbi:MAG: HAMP domain-containing histidine kinase [Leptospiraceae bacterium]|nr:HAMP domain-containing histidine kinase [Leptospiraceae bacterium]MCK6382372.1 HAMP domain-containing histidine kinase [Leptospiraceae bacterium]NUM40712.1 HAMP domain-containing histidine kinase [Leptospiraceae bacterium]